jgi:hypothetical protein
MHKWITAPSFGLALSASPGIVHALFIVIRMLRDDGEDEDIESREGSDDGPSIARDPLLLKVHFIKLCIFCWQKPFPSSLLGEYLGN